MNKIFKVADKEMLERDVTGLLEQGYMVRYDSEPNFPCLMFGIRDSVGLVILYFFDPLLAE